MNPLPAVHLLTAPRRDALLAATLACWDRTDWGARPTIHRDTGTAATAAERIPAAWGAMLHRALASGETPHLLLLEDDLDFAQHLRQALLHWPPLTTGTITTFASLYDPGLPAHPPHTAADAHRTHFPAHPRYFFGAQALLLTRPFAAWAVARFAQHGGPQSRRLIALAGEFAPGAPIPVHRPSLIQHTARASAWGVRLHRAPHFDPAWRPPAAG